MQLVKHFSLNPSLTKKILSIMLDLRDLNKLPRRQDTDILSSPASLVIGYPIDAWLEELRFSFTGTYTYIKKSLYASLTTYTTLCISALCYMLEMCTSQLFVCSGDFSKQRVKAG